MRSHAKAPTAFTFGRRGFVAPALIALALAALFALSFSSSAFAAKKTAFSIGSPTGATGATAGLLNQPRGVAVNQAGTGGASPGDIYVVEGANNRISQFKADGTFVRAFGLDVVSSGPDQAREIQWVTVKATAGTFRLTFSGQNTSATGTGDVTESSTTVSNLTGPKFTVGKRITGTGIPAGTTIEAVGPGTLTLSQPATATNAGVALSADLPVNAPASVVQGALNALSNIGGLLPTPGSVSVTGGPGDASGTSPYVVTFDGGPLAGTNVAQMTSANGFEAMSGGTGTGANTAVVLTARAGSNGYEICNALANPTDVCKAGSSSGGLGGTLNSPQGVAINQSTGDLYVTDGPNNLRVQQYTATGQWVRAWGGDVVVPGGVGESFVQVNEVQTVTLLDVGIGTGIKGGTFTLSFDGPTTGAIDFDATAAEVESALIGLSNIGAGDIVVSGAAKGPWTVEFTGTLGQANVAQMVGDGSQLESSLPGTGFAAVATNQQGGPSGGPEACSISHQCKAGVAGPFAGGFGPMSAAVGPGSVNFTPAPAVVPAGAPEAGNVLLPDPGNRRMQEFSPSGAFVRAFGFDTAKGGASGYEICSVAVECKSGTTGEGLGQFGPNSPSRAAVSADGTVYVIDSGLPSEQVPNARLMAFDSTRTTPTFFAPDHFAVPSPPKEIAIGPGHRVFVLHECPANPGSVTYEEYCPGGKTDGENRIREFDDQGALVESHAVGFGFGFSSGLAANTASDRLYLTTAALEQKGGHRVWVLDDKGSQPPPILTVNPPTAIGEHTATFSGTVNPNGLPGVPSSYHFEVSKNGATWTPIAADVNLGSGTSPISVPVAPAEGQATGLEANTFYRVRIIATRPFGAGSFPSPELTFLTDGVKPEVTTYHPQSHTDTTARLTGLLNANNMPTTYHFEYGETTAYGSSAPVSPGAASDGVSHLVFAEAEGLKPNTTYHYRLVATNAEGTSKGNDVTFKTYAPGVSAKPQRAYEMMTPPFKVVRAPTSFGGAVGNNPNPGVPSLDGNSMLWTTSIFPLTDDVKAPAGGDRRLLTRTAEGWTFRTLNTASPKMQSAGEIVPGAGTNFAKHFWGAVSGDQKTLTLRTENQALLPNEGWGNNLAYTYREGTGAEGGYTPWLANVDTQIAPFSPTESQYEDLSKLNDAGTALLRWGDYRGVAEDPSTPWDDDPSDEQQNAGRSAYLVRSADPDGLPTAPKETVHECTGTGAGATEIPDRVGTGSAATDTIGSRPCEEAPTAHAATGTGVRSTGSASLTGVTTSSGAFSVGQIVSGTGIPRGATITAVGAGTLTISSPVLCGGAKAGGAALGASAPVRTVAGSPVVIARPYCGAFEAGQTITGTGIPGGTTILAVEKYELTLSASVTATTGPFDNPEILAAGPSTTSLAAGAQHITGRGGARGGGLGETWTGAISEDGKRVFFMSPSGEPSPTCSNGAGKTGVNTDCPPQLFVRQHDSNGEATVRWISRAQGVGAQQIGLIGQGASFEGASRDGRHVYFKTNAPLLPTDPNAGSSITTGTAQANSWDLYRYTLPESLDDDPADGTLLRVTGGPTGTADPSTNNVDTPGSVFPPGALRYFSDDGRRAYFVTTAEIPGAINSPPGGGSTAPGGAVGNTATRNLYLFDDTGDAPKWRFIARLPYAFTRSNTDPAALNGCASFYAGLGNGHLEVNAGGMERVQKASNCFRGTPDGSGVIFFTRGQLTSDDRDDAGDVYLYDAESDELVRVSAPEKPSAAPYPCNRDTSGTGAGVCNADLGISQTGPSFAGLGKLDNNRGWGGGRHYNVGHDTNGTIRVFFESQSELVAEDTNGDHMDVYEWSNGRLSLVSPGNTESQSFYSGNSVDGRDVFLFTSARIDPREIDDDDFDLYDVRVGGGFPYTPPPTPCDVLAHECRPNALPAAAPRSAASSSLNGTGNVKATPKRKRCAKGKVQRKGRCVQKQSKAKKQKKKRATKQTGRASR